MKNAGRDLRKKPALGVFPPLCHGCLETHTLTLPEGYPHKVFSIAYCSAIVNEAQFFAFVKRNAKYDDVKYDQNHRIQAARRWTDDFNKTCDAAISKIEAFRQQYQAQMAEYCDLVTREVRQMIEEVDRLLVDPNFEAKSPLTCTSWSYITEKTSHFKPVLNLEVYPNSLIKWLNDKVNIFVNVPEKGTLINEGEAYADFPAKWITSERLNRELTEKLTVEEQRNAILEFSLRQMESTLEKFRTNSSRELPAKLTVAEKGSAEANLKRANAELKELRRDLAASEARAANH